MPVSYGCCPVAQEMIESTDITISHERIDFVLIISDLLILESVVYSLQKQMLLANDKD
jgi:hypothetical protein